GWGDLILFPRYDVFKKSTLTKKVEITLGLGIKIPVGNPKDTLRQVEPFSGKEFYILKPVAIRTTSGAQDIIFYASLFRGFPKSNFRVFSNLLYIKKGWNELGEKAGDYASIGLFAGKTLFENLGITLQVKGEWIDSMKTNSDLLLFGYFNYDPKATGSKKVLLIPQLSYSFKSFSAYVSAEFPLYQYVNKQQIASQHFVTTGITYKFIPVKTKVSTGMYFCPMHPEKTNTVPGACPECGMNLELKK
ncbi:MAG: hypothetical protein NT126_00710, partial [Bacteroidetes bacterium]|nr:hypothetical protein [Bacteroidota bacterium]